MKKGLRERILDADSVEEIKSLLAELETYQFASAKTVLACHSAAKRRTAQLKEKGKS